MPFCTCDDDGNKMLQKTSILTHLKIGTVKIFCGEFHKNQRLNKKLYKCKICC